MLLLLFFIKKKKRKKTRLKTNSACMFDIPYMQMRPNTHSTYVFSFEFFGFAFHKLFSLTHNISLNTCVKQTLAYPFHFTYFSFSLSQFRPSYCIYSRRLDAQHEIQKIYSYFNWMLLLSAFPMRSLFHIPFECVFFFLFSFLPVCICILPDIFRYKMKTIQLSCFCNYVKHSQIVEGVLCNVMMIILAQNSIFL